MYFRTVVNGRASSRRTAESGTSLSVLSGRGHVLRAVHVVEIENPCRADQWPVAGASDTDERNPAVGDAKRVDPVPLGVGEDRDVTVERDAGRALERRPRGHALARCTVEDDETVWRVGGGGCRDYAHGVRRSEATTLVSAAAACRWAAGR